MASLTNHADFLKATRDQRVVTKDMLLNEATKNTYFFFSRMLTGSQKKFKGGTKLVDKIQGTTSGNFSFYSPNHEFSPTQTDTLTDVEVQWAFAQDHYVIIDETAQLNSGDPYAYLDYVKSLEMDCMVDMINGMEEALWKTPDNAVHEASSADPQEPYSILCFVTRDGLEPSSTNGGATNDFTTIMSVDPSNDSWFQNANNTYTAATPDDPEAGLIASFDDMRLQIGFEFPDPLSKYSESDDKQKYCIVTSRDGVVFYKSRLRMGNDRMERLSDPSIMGPQFEGIPIKYVSELDQQGWTANQPDYIWLNLNFLFPIFHTNRFMYEVIRDGGPKQPTSVVNFKFSWYNLFCRSRRRQGRTYAA